MLKQTDYQTAIVTGASKGIGRAVTQALCDLSLNVHAIARSAADLQSLADECGCTPHSFDINDGERLQAVIEAASPDILVANAGILPSVAPYQDMPWCEIEQMIEINLTATLRTISLVLPGMIERNRGHILIIGSSAALCPHPGVAAYGATKAALHHFCRSLRCDLLGSNIRISEIVPGRVETHLYHQFLGEAGARDKLYAGIQALQPADIASAVVSIIQTPPHVDVTHYEVMPLMQVMGGSRVHHEQA